MQNHRRTARDTPFTAISWARPCMSPMPTRATDRPSQSARAALHIDESLMRAHDPSDQITIGRACIHALVAVPDNLVLLVLQADAGGIEMGFRRRGGFA